MQISSFGKVFIICVSLFVSSFIGVKITSNQLQTHIMDYALEQTKKTMTYISTSVVDEMCQEYDLNKRKIIEYDQNEAEVVSINYDTNFLNVFLKEATQRTLLKIKSVEAGNYEEDFFNGSKINKSKSGVIYDVPIGLITNNIILSNVGGTIPIKFTSIGSVEGNISTTTSSFGINNALININLNLSISAKVIVPNLVELQNTNVEIPILMHVINGKVPSYYFGSKTVCKSYSEEVKL